VALGLTQPLIEMSTRNSSWEGGKHGQCVGMKTLPPSCTGCLESGSLKILEPYVPVQACNGTALLYTKCMVLSLQLLGMDHSKAQSKYQDDKTYKKKPFKVKKGCRHSIALCNSCSFDPKCFLSLTCTWLITCRLGALQPQCTQTYINPLKTQCRLLFFNPFRSYVRPCLTLWFSCSRRFSSYSTDFSQQIAQVVFFLFTFFSFKTVG
jgi:hypothetical protein